MSPYLDQQALDLINAWEAGAYLHPAQKKAALQVAIRDALAQARAEGMRQAAEVAATIAPKSIGRDHGRHHEAGAQHAARRIRALTEDRE